MEFSVKSGLPEKQRTACVVVGVFENRKLTPAAESLDAASGGRLGRILARGDLEGKPGQTMTLYELPGVTAERIMLVGCGKRAEVHDRQFREAVQKSAAVLVSMGAANAVTYLPEVEVRGQDLSHRARATVEAVEQAAYRFERLKSKPGPRRRLVKVSLASRDRQEQPQLEAGARIGQAVAAGSNLVRDLGNLPGNICTPSYLAEQARTLAASDDRFTLHVLERPEMEELGMGALLAVARGSEQPPRLIVLEYRNADADVRPHVLVGKGVTFDTGGISIKPAAEMDEMKFDMCGAASVLGALTTVSRLDLALNVVGIIAAVENMPSGNATRPGDIVTSMSGQTVEILNTDAEGRLILCDALTYAERYKPASVVDMATLTGAIIIALGRHPSGLFTNDEGLAAALQSAADRSGDRVWRMPLWEDYQSALDSNFADVANIGGRDGGSITAACFLARFTKAYRWAHLDIAGTAWKTGKEKGGTGRPVPLLAQYLLDQADKT